jgi:hypothetical protein
MWWISVSAGMAMRRELSRVSISWYLQPKGEDCHVVMDEAGIGKDAAALRQSDETLMHRGHDLWLATLKWVAEGK